MRSGDSPRVGWRYDEQTFLDGTTGDIASGRGSRVNCNDNPMLETKSQGGGTVSDLDTRVWTTIVGMSA